MNKYLEKIAEQGKKKKELHPGKALGSFLVAGTAANLATAGPHAKFNQAVDKAIHGSSASGADLHTIRKFMKDNGLHKDVSFNTRKHFVDKAGFTGRVGAGYKHMVRNSSGSPAYIPPHHIGAGNTKGFVIGSRKIEGGHINPDILMHELGHAKDYKSFGGVKKLLTTLRSPLAQGITGGATIAALSNEKTRDYAPAIAAIPGLSMLREEAAANFHAFKGIKAHKGSAAANKFLKKLVPKQMAGYAMAASAPVLGAYGAKKMMEAWTKPKKK